MRTACFNQNGMLHTCSRRAAPGIPGIFSPRHFQTVRNSCPSFKVSTRIFSRIHQLMSPRHASTTLESRLSVDNISEADSAFARIVSDGAMVNVYFSADACSSFHASWLWSNDPAFVHPSSGQRLRSTYTYYGWKVHTAEIVTDEFANVSDTLDQETAVQARPSWGSYHPIGGLYKHEDHVQHATDEKLSLKVEWRSICTNESTISYYDLDWLFRNRYDDNAVQERHDATVVTPLNALRRYSELTRVSYARLTDSSKTEDAKFDILDAAVRDGAVIVENCHVGEDGDTEKLVSSIGRTLSGGALSHGQLYGDVFHVKSVANANNIAYTSYLLPPHQDLAYYDSKPGLQLLHCVNNKGVQGGESILIDSLAAAYKLKEIAPEYYTTLLQCKATFLKQREGADMVYRRPHIEEDSSSGCPSAVHYSPPFMGPLGIESHLVDDYFCAISILERMLDSSLLKDKYILPFISNTLEQELIDYAQAYTWHYALQIGEVLVFNNQRMLHGRNAFKLTSDSPNCGRHLVGCYTDMDDTLNQYRIMRRNRLNGPRDVQYMRNTGNGSSSVM